MARLEARAGLDARKRELPCDPGAAEKMTAEVFGAGRAADLAHWLSDGGASVAIECGGEVAAFAYRRGERICGGARRDVVPQGGGCRGGGRRERRGKRDAARSRRLRFAARGAGQLQLPHRRCSWRRGRLGRPGSTSRRGPSLISYSRRRSKPPVRAAGLRAAGPAEGAGIRTRSRTGFRAPTRRTGVPSRRSIAHEGAEETEGGADSRMRAPRVWPR